MDARTDWYREAKRLMNSLDREWGSMSSDDMQRVADALRHAFEDGQRSMSGPLPTKEA